MIKGLNHITLAVRHLPTSFNFYKDILGFQPLCRWAKGAYFLAGDLWFCLFEDLTASPGKGYTHIAFSVSTEDFPSMVDRLNKAEVLTWKENTSEGDSLYFLDPEGYQLSSTLVIGVAGLRIKSSILGQGLNFLKNNFFGHHIDMVVTIPTWTPK